MASLYQRKGSPFFWIKYRAANGELKQKSTKCRIDVPAEVRKAKQIEAEKALEELKQADPRKIHSGWAWVPEYLNVRYQSSPITLERYLCGWKTVRMFIDERKIISPVFLTRAHCFDYVTWRQKPDKRRGKYKACLNTALFELKVLRIALQEAVERDIITGNPCMKLGIDRAKPKEKSELTDADCEKIRAEIQKVEDPFQKEMLANSFEIARYQGCRLTETRLNPQRDVTIIGDRGEIMFRAKGGKEFSTLLHPKLVPLFERLKREHKQETWSVPPGSGRQWASACWWRFLDRIGLKQKNVCFHSTRVTVVTELARNNVPESKAKSYVGHSSTTVHRIYQRLRTDDLGDCTEAIG